LGEVEKERELIKKTETETGEEIFLKRFREFVGENKKRINKAKKLMADLISGKFKNEYDGIYLKKSAINGISNKWLKNPAIFLKELPQASKLKRNKESLTIKPFVSLLDVKNALEKLEELGEHVFKDRYYKSKNNDDRPLKDSQEKYWDQFLKVWKYEFDNLFKDKFNEAGIQIEWGYTNKLKKEAEELNSFFHRKKEIHVIKNYSDAVLKIYQMMKFFSLEAKNERDIPVDYSTEFYGHFNEYYQDFLFFRYYNAFRNYITKKPSDKEKIKINFGSGELLGGWDISRISSNLGLIFVKNKEYYLGIVKKGINHLFDYHINRNDRPDSIKKKEDLRREILAKPGEDYYLIMKYRQIADAGKDIHNLILMPNGTVERSPSVDKKEKYWPPEIKRIKKNKSYQTNKEDLITFIDYFKKCTLIYWKEYDLKFKPSHKYKNLKEFTDSINVQGYSVSLDEKIKAEYIEKQVNNGNLYLFKIINKDFYRYKKPGSRKNIHTLYWEQIFSKKNLRESEYPFIRLGGEAEIFYRDAIKIEKEAVILKKTKRRVLRENKPVYRWNRYLEGKYLFHCPLIINFPFPNKNSTKSAFNKEINKFLSLQPNGNINIIGIDRGEKNLLYYTVINQKEEILEHGSLNEINGVNYFEKLLEREKERQLNRQSWEPIARIKDLKRGYLSYVVRKIADLVEKYNAIIVLEDLNMRFKQIRGGIERTVYQQFEKQLIDKFSYLIFKDNREPKEPGGVLSGYQLVAPFTTFKDLNKQTGIIFYTNAEYTSKTDPITGYRRNIYISNSAPLRRIKELINKLKALGWDEKESGYFFVYNQRDFDDNFKKNKEWILFSKIPRVKKEKDNKTGYWEYKQINLNYEFEDLFSRYNINAKSKDILSNIKDIFQKDEKRLTRKFVFDRKERNFYERFIYLFNIILEARNTISIQVKIDKGGNKLKEIDYGVDFFASPVKPFFTTAGIRYLGRDDEGKIKRIEKERFTEANLMNMVFRGCSLDGFDSDGVGAYNIARKGIIILERIKNNPEKSKLIISKEDWDSFVQQ